MSLEMCKFFRARFIIANSETMEPATVTKSSRLSECLMAVFHILKCDCVKSIISLPPNTHLSSLSAFFFFPTVSFPYLPSMLLAVAMMT